MTRIQSRRVLRIQIAGEVAVIVVVTFGWLAAVLSLAGRDIPVLSGIFLAMTAFLTVLRILRARCEALLNELDDLRISR